MPSDNRPSARASVAYPVQAHLLLASDRVLPAVRRLSRGERAITSERWRSSNRAGRCCYRSACSSTESRRSRVTRAGLQEAAGRMNVVFLSYWLGPRSLISVGGQPARSSNFSSCRRATALPRSWTPIVRSSKRASAIRLDGQLRAGAAVVRHPPGAGAIIHPRRLSRRPRPRRPAARAERGDAAGVRRVPSLFHRGRDTITVAPALALAIRLDLAASPRHGGAPPRRRSGGGRTRLPPAAQRRPRDRRHPRAIQHSRHHRVDRARCHPGGVRSVAARTVLDHPLRRARHRQPGAARSTPAWSCRRTQTATCCRPVTCSTSRCTPIS